MACRTHTYIHQHIRGVRGRAHEPLPLRVIVREREGTSTESPRIVRVAYAITKT